MFYKAPEQMPVIGIGSIKNLNTGLYFCTFFGEFSSNKIDSNMQYKAPVIDIGSIKNLNTGSYFCTFFGEFSSNTIDSNM